MCLTLPFRMNYMHTEVRGCELFSACYGIRWPIRLKWVNDAASRRVSNRRSVIWLAAETEISSAKGLGGP